MSSIADGPGDEALESGLASRTDIVVLPRRGTGAVASVAAFGGNPSFSPSPSSPWSRHPGGVGAIEAALIGGRATNALTAAPGSA